MQSIGWYFGRLRSMSAAEVLWRGSGKVRDVVDRMVASSRRRVPAIETVVARGGRERLLKADVLGRHLRDMDAAGDYPLPWKSALVARADSVAAHKLSFFDLKDVELGFPVQWNYEHKARRETPTGYSGGIDYRDHRVTGDCKFVWEPNRHHQLVTLGRAYRVTGEERYAEAAMEMLDSWIEQCPFGTGMNWRSPLELAIRLINWAWTIELIRPSEALCGERADRIVSTAWRHLWEISRKYSKYSSANNHLIGEAAGVFIGASYFAGLRDAARLREESRRILEREIIAQTYADGGTREQASGYHLFVMQFFLLAGLVGRQDGHDFSPGYWQRLEKMFEFVAALAAGGDVPLIGDADDGYVLDLGEKLSDVRSLMGVGACLYGRSDFGRVGGSFTESAYWLFGDDGRRRFESLGVGKGAAPLAGQAFCETGYFLLQRGTAGRPDAISVVFDCGDLGYESIAAHGHADALSLTLRVGGRDVLVDPGTYDYFTYPQWRTYFRSTRAHNTVCVDGLDQSVMLGSFLWGRQARSTSRTWSPTAEGGVVRGEHDGYARLDDPVIHRRTVELGGEPALLVVRDELDAGSTHEWTLHWHLAPNVQVTSAGHNRFTVKGENFTVQIEMDARLTTSVQTGCGNPIIGWHSEGYHRKSPSPTLAATCRCAGPVTFVTRMTIELHEAGGERDGSAEMGSSAYGSDPQGASEADGFWAASGPGRNQK